MSDIRATKNHQLMMKTNSIRNISVIAHVDHGKSTLTDSLVIRAGISKQEGHGSRYMDTRKDEQARGITIKSTAISMSFQLNDDLLNAYCEKDDFDGNNFLINLIDSPGHIDFSSEVTAALRVTDGALVVIDLIEGSCVQTLNVLNQAIEERVKPTLVLNKIDRSLLELDHTPEEFFDLCIDRVNAFNERLAAFQEDKIYFKPVSPIRNDVSFCSGLQGWGFTLNLIGRKYLSANGSHTHEKEKMFTKTLFSKNIYCDFEGQFPKNYKFKKLGKNEVLPPNKSCAFIQLVAQPLYKLRDLCFGKKIDEIFEFLKQYQTDVKDLKIDAKMDEKIIFKAVFKTFLPSADCLLEQIIVTLPNPPKSQRMRADLLYTGPNTDESFKAIQACSTSEDAPVVVYVSKMVPHGENKGFIAFGRVFSGVLMPNKKYYVMNPDYEPIDEAGENTIKLTTNTRMIKNISKIVVMMGKTTMAIPNCPAGNLVGILGVEGFLLKTGTIASSPTAHIIKTMKFSVSPVVRVAVSPKQTQDLAKFKEALESLAKTDPCAVVEYKNNQALICVAGELQLEIFITDLINLFNGKAFNVDNPQVKFYEGVQGSVNVSKMTKSANKHNRIYMTAESLDLEVADNLCHVIHKDPKIRSQLFREKLNVDEEWVPKIMCFAPEEEPLNVFVDMTKGIQNLHESKDHLRAGIMLACREGPILGEMVRGVRFNLVDLVLHPDSIHRGANQLPRPTQLNAMGLILASGPCIYEPVYECVIDVTVEYQSQCEQVIKKNRGSVHAIEGGQKRSLKCLLPVLESFGINKKLREVSAGNASTSFRFDHYQVTPGSIDDPNSIAGKIVQAKALKDGRKPIDLKDLSYYFDTL